MTAPPGHAGSLQSREGHADGDQSRSWPWEQGQWAEEGAAKPPRLGFFSCRLGEDEAAAWKGLDADSVFKAGDFGDSSGGEIFGLVAFGRYTNGLGFLDKHVRATCPREKQDRHLTWLEHDRAK